MKVRMNLSGAAISEFFATNGEKFVLAITVAVMLLFVYGAITAKPLESDMPGKIQSESSRAQERIKEKPWKEKLAEEPELAAVSFAKAVADGGDEVQLSRLELDYEWNPPLFRELVKRADPEIFPVQELRVATGFALVPYKADIAAAPAAQQQGAPPVHGAPAVPFNYGMPSYGPTGDYGPTGAGLSPSQANLPGARMTGQGTEARPRFYAVITGLVPLEKQMGEYRRRFEYAMKTPDNMTGARSDGSYVPAYHYTIVERAEVKDENDANLQWKRVDETAYLQLKDWADMATQLTEIVDPMYLDPMRDASTRLPLVAWPLPPLLLRDWGLEASHPKIPLSKLQTDMTTPATEPTEEFNPLNPGAVALQAQGAQGIHQQYGPHGMSGYAPSSMPMGGGYGGSYLNPSAPLPTHRLMRFVDLSAEPGKLYRYRVQLTVQNPNYGLHPQYLAKADSAKESLRYSAWSEPTPPVRVPAQAELLAVAAAALRGEATARVNIHALLAEPPVELLAQKFSDRENIDLAVGSVANFRDVTIPKVVDIVADQVRDIGPVNLNALDALVLDIRNDDPLGATSRSKGPTELLLMDSSGQMHVANSASDAAKINDYRKRADMPAAAATEGGMAPVLQPTFGPPPSVRPPERR